MTVGSPSPVTGDTWTFWLAGLQADGVPLVDTTPGLVIQASVVLNNVAWGGPYFPIYNTNTGSWEFQLELPGPGPLAVRWLITYGLLTKSIETSLYVEERGSQVAVIGQSNLSWDQGPAGPAGPAGAAGAPGTTDHLLLLNIGTNTHAQIDTHIAAANPHSGSAADSAVVHNTGAEAIGGVKTFSSAPVVPAEVYGASWNGKQEPAPKDAVYDKIETIGAAGGAAVFVATAVETITGVAVLTDYTTQRYTIPANNATVGKVYRITARGLASNSSGTARTLNFHVRLGGVTIASAGNVNIASGASNLGWEIQFDLVVITIGAGGTAEAQGKRIHNNTLADMSNTTTVAFDTTAAKTFGIAITPEVAAVSVTQRQLIVQAL